MTFGLLRKRPILYGVLPAVLFGIVALAFVLVITILNADLYGRLTETTSAGSAFSARAGDPTIRLILHRVVTDENAVEASLILTLDRKSFDKFKAEGNQHLRAAVFDASFQPFGVGGSVTVDLASAEAAPEPGVNIISHQSARFMLPTAPSLRGFPFDDLSVRVFTELRGTRFVVYPHFVEVEKMLPGRLIDVSLQGGAVYAVLSRTTT